MGQTGLPITQGLTEWTKLSVLGHLVLRDIASPHPAGIHGRQGHKELAKGALIPCPPLVSWVCDVTLGAQLSLSSLSPYAPSWLREEAPGVWGARLAVFLLSGAPVRKTDESRDASVPRLEDP